MTASASSRRQARIGPPAVQIAAGAGGDAGQRDSDKCGPMNAAGDQQTGRRHRESHLRQAQHEPQPTPHDAMFTGDWNARKPPEGLSYRRLPALSVATTTPVPRRQTEQETADRDSENQQQRSAVGLLVPHVVGATRILENAQRDLIDRLKQTGRIILIPQRREDQRSGFARHAGDRQHATGDDPGAQRPAAQYPR